MTPGEIRKARILASLTEDPAGKYLLKALDLIECLRKNNAELTSMHSDAMGCNHALRKEIRHLQECLNRGAS